MSIDSHHDQNNWDIKNYVDLVDKLSKKKYYLYKFFSF